MTSTQQMFNPSLEEYEILKEMVMERGDELESILGRLESTPVKGTSRSFVVIGQRGMGKTHFLILLYHEIKKRKNMKNKYVSLKFSEEEYSIDSLAYFFIRILEELKNECDSQEEKERLSGEEERIKEFLDLSVGLDDKKLVKQSDRFLEEMFQKHKMKMVLCADNLDKIFENIVSFEKTGLNHLRSILQSKDYLLIIGSAPTFFKEIQNHDEPFYSYFEIIRLPPLSGEGVEELIKKLAEMEDDTRIIEEFDTFKPRIKTIIHFTSGVPRLVRMLYYVIANSEITEVADSLEKLLDELTPYYQARMMRLSPQQQKIIDTMALLGGPSTPTEIAKAGRMERPTVNAQLKKLVDTGFVHLVQQKRRKWRRYDITERMFRIWREMRREKSGNRVKYLADFLKAFYTKDEFKRHRESIDEKFSHSIQNGKDSDALKYIKEYEFMKEIIPHEMLPDFECCLIEKYIQVDELKKAEVELNFIKDLKGKRKMPKEFDEKIFKLEMKKIEKSIEKNPNDFFNYFKKGNLLQTKNEYDNAINEYDKALKINPEYEPTLMIKAITLFNMNNVNEAIKQFGNIIKRNKQNTDAYIARALMKFHLGKYEGSIDDLDRVLKIDPSNEDALLWKARSLFKLEKYEEAIKELNKALKINPKNEDALLMKGKSFGSLEKYKEALVEIEKVLTINPKNENAQYWKARAFFNLEKYEKAIKEFEKVLKINPKDEDAQYWKTRALLELEKYEEAIKEFDKILKINPKNEDARSDKAGLFFNLKKYEEAINEFNKVLKINPKNEDAQYWKAESFSQLGKYEEAIKEYEKVLKINPKNEDALREVGSCYLLDNDHESFITWFDNIEPSKRQFDSIFKSWTFNYEFERKNAIDFLKESVSYKDRSEEFPKFWDNLLRFTIHEILHFSAEDFKVKNFGSAREKLSLLFENKELWEGEDVYNFFLDYFVGLLKIDINHAEEILDLFKERLGEGFKGTFSTLDKTIAYLKLRDEELLEKMFPEEREVVEGLLERIENESP